MLPIGNAPNLAMKFFQTCMEPLLCVALRLGHCWVILSQSKSRTRKTLDNTHSQTTLKYTLVITHTPHITIYKHKNIS
jgi:hypothetical protein